ncbi:MAG: efflux RND transporter periplasmic adaptor subunit [Patescibacteria group bacterium]|nr:efflux RND transporter periplasmic adaptor subunit [Patescibacteria group bacterium]
MQKKSILFIGITVLIGIIIYLLWLTFQPANSAVSFQTASVKKGNLLVTVSASGSVVSGGNTNAITQASGTVIHIYVTEGQNVHTGDKVAEIQLDSQGIQNRDKLWSTYLTAKAAVDSAKAKQYALQAQMFLDNQTFMNGAVASHFPSYNPTYAQQNAQWLSSEAQYKNQETVIQQTEADLATAWRDYQNVTGIITAPISGTVVGLKAVAGMPITGSIGANSAPVVIATIQSEKQVFGQFQVSEMDMSKVKVGQKAQLSIPAIPGKTFTGTVVAIDTTGLAKSGVIHFPVTVTIDNPTPELLTNMSADVKIILSEKDHVLLLPSSAIQDTNGTSVVQVIKNGKVFPVPVQVGLSNDTQTEILSGLSQNDMVVTGTQANQIPQNGITSPFGGLSSPGNLAAPGGGNN